jgi:hypothetical protein
MRDFVPREELRVDRSTAILSSFATSSTSRKGVDVLQGMALENDQIRVEADGSAL